MNHLPHIFQMIDVQILMLEVQLLANLITHLLSLSKEKQGQANGSPPGKLKAPLKDLRG